MKRTAAGIESRVLFVALAPVIATAVAMALYFTVLRYNDLESALRQRGIAMARQLAPAAQYGLFSGNVAELNRLIEALSREPDVSAITIYDQYGKPLAAIGKAIASPPARGLDNGWHEQDENNKVISFHSKVFAAALPLDEPSSGRTATAPHNLSLGSVTIELSRDNLVAKQREILIFTVGATLLMLAIAASIGRRLGRDISEPVIALEDSVRKISEGVLASRVSPHPAGTLRSLEEGINLMAVALERAKRRSNEALSHSNTQLEQQSNFANALLEAQSAAGVSMIIIENGKLIFANQAAARLSGRTLAEMNQLDSLVGVIAEPDRVEFEQKYQRIQRGKDLSSRVEVAVLRPNGSECWVEVASFAIERGKTAQIVMLGVDITQRKQDARQLMLAHEELRAQKDLAELASSAKSRFLAAASHDLRQPLHALTLFSDQLRAHSLLPGQSQLVEQISSAIRNMSELLASLLDISKLDLANLKPEPSLIDLDALLRQIADTYRPTAEHRQLRLRVVPTSLRIISDPGFLSRIVANLISNAVRYTHHGGIVIGARRRGSQVRIEIWDTGIGIEPAHIPLLFQEFYQVDNPERDAGKGLGLGLAIADRLTNALGHRTYVRSKPGKGSVFSIEVPRGWPAEARSEAMAPIQSTSILIAVEDSNLRDELSQLVGKWGYAARPCRAEKIADMLANSLPDLVLSDLHCRALIDKVLGATAVADIPMILLSGETAANANLSKNHVGVQLEVPIKPAKLRALILHFTAIGAI